MIQPFELLEQAAANNPNGIGLVSPTSQFTFSKMLENSLQIAGNLSQAGVKSRQLVSTFLPPATDWLSTLAIFHEAAVPISLWGTGKVSKLNVSWFVAGSYRSDIPKQRTILVDLESTVSELGTTNSQSRTLFSRPDTAMRYVLTSGTTGEPKAVCFTGKTIANRMSVLDNYWTDARPELNFMGLSSTGGFFSALAALKHGYPYLAEVAIDRGTLERARNHQIQVLAGSPSQIGLALKLMKEHNLEIPSLREVRTAGSSPTQRLVSAVHEQLGVSIKSVYGSTEGGGIAFNLLSPGDDISNLGTLVPGVELEIVDESNHNPMPTGMGQLRYRGPGLADGYLDATDTSESFRDGWFYPGDSGQLDEQGRYVLAGRSDEVLNVGGTKINPATVEDAALQFEGVKDAAICLVERFAGIEEVAIALEPGGPLDSRKLDKELRAKFPTAHPTIFMNLKQIPRNQMGKVLRDQLRDEILKGLSGS
jgi:long-chain acyl-CoA synthetase